MSDYERIKGKVVFVGRLTEEEREAYIKSKYNEYADEPVNEIPEYYDSWYEAFNDVYWDRDLQFILIDKYSLWFAYDLTEMEVDDYYCYVTPTNEKEFEFDTQYYNGGCCWRDMLYDELEGLSV